jgi:SET domain-containing protein
MAKAKKIGKPKGNRKNIVKNMKRIQKNNEILKSLAESLDN